MTQHETTKTRIEAAAAHLFAEHGYEATSMRMITAEAGVNLAAVNYHFGSKEALLRTILDRAVVPVNEARFRMLDDLLAIEPNPDAEAIMRAFLAPDVAAIVRLNRAGENQARFVARMYIEASDLMAEIALEQFAEARRRFFAALLGALPHLDEDELAYRMQCVIGIIVYAFAGIATTAGLPLVDPEDEAGSLDRLIAFILPGLVAPSEKGARARRL